MTLGALIERAGLDPSTLAGDDPSLEQTVTGVTLDSREIEPGHVFIALQGARADGVVFAGQARTRGAIAVVAEMPAPDDVSSPWITVGDGRRAVAALAAAFHGDPSHELTVIGVTGTNGKTTTTYVAESILDQAGIRCGRVGSVSYRVSADAEEQMADRTTPEAPVLHGLLRRMVTRGCGACVMEVSSHALALRRVDGVRFGAAVFTNLTRDHLDFHGDMEAYFETKQRLFEMLPETAPAIINADDPHGPALAARCAKPVTFAFDAPADVAPARAELTLDGLILDVRTPRGTLHLTSRLLGRNNAYNVLAATAAAVALDISFQAIEGGVRALEAVPGRMEVVSSDADDITVLVDFAHTDDALRGLLETARPLARGRLVTVFGCGGDRDPTKRPLMGAVAARLSDRVVLTSDNPRSEDPGAILREIALGFGQADGDRDRIGGATHVAIVDRAEAIEQTVSDANASDLIVIAGKGHERYQVIGERTVPFEDAAIVRQALARRRSRSRVG